LLPMLVLLLLLTFYTLPLYLLDKYDMDDNDTRRMRRDRLRTNSTKLVLFTIFLLFPGTSRKALHYFLCHKVEGVNYLAEDFRFQCYDAQWNRFLPFAVFSLIIYPIGIPCALFFLLWKQHLRGFVSRGYEFLYAAYHIEMWWFELVDMVIKLFITSMVAFFVGWFQLPGGMIAVAVYMLLVLLFHPHIRRIDDRLQMLSLTEIWLFLLVGYTSRFDELKPGSSLDVTLSALLISVVTIVFLLLIYHIILTARNKYTQYLRMKMMRLSERQEYEPSKVDPSSQIHHEGHDDRNSVSNPGKPSISMPDSFSDENLPQDTNYVG